MEENKDLFFREDLEDLSHSFGKGNQEGVKAALRVCQDYFDQVSESHISEIASAFEVDEKIINTLLRFMPGIKKSALVYDIVCCTGPRCAKRNSAEVIKVIRSELGFDFNQTSCDGKVRLRSQNCFRHCTKGPNVLVNDKFFHNMDAEKAKDLMKKIKEDL